MGVQVGRVRVSLRGPLSCVIDVIRLLVMIYRHEFEWRREECFIVRKPDPPVLVAVTKEPPGRIKTSSVQLLDYNLQRYYALLQSAPNSHAQFVS